MQIHPLHHFTLGCLLLFVLSAIMPAFLYAQVDTGRVAGTVTDITGAVVAGARISLTNVATGVVQRAISSSSGTYIFGAVNPGTYTITAESQGFQKATTTGIEAHVQQNLTSDITLTPGNVDQVITVSSAAPLLQAEDASIGQTITGGDINNLPLSGRNWVSLAQLAAGVTTTAGGTPGSALFVTNGVNFWQNDIRLNGIDDNEEVYGGTQFNTNAAFTPPPDAIEEFKLQTGDFSAEFGHSTGSVVNAVIKSGTNNLHGDLWEYIRNTVFNANDYFANNYADPKLRLRPAYHQNQFGGQYSDIPNASSGYNGAADFLLIPTASTVGGPNNLGGVSSYSSSNYAQTKTQRYYIAGYFQDDWKATPNLTLNLGLRWDHYTPNAEVRGRQANFVQDGGNGPSGTFYMSPKGCAVPRSANFDALLAANNIKLNCTASNATGEAQNYNFAPRLGFAFRATPKIALRGGYGIAYGALDNIGFGGTLGTNYPFNYSVGFNAVNSVTPLTIPSGQTATIENALIGQNLQDPTVVSGAGVGLSGREYLFRTPYTQTFNVTAQDQFTNHDSIQLAYVGTLGRHLDSTGSHNSVSAILPVGTDYLDPTVQGHVPFPVFSRDSAFQRADANSSYNSLQATYQHQLSAGPTVLANYTYAKCLTDQRTISGGSPGFRAQWLPGFGIHGDYGLCDSDTAHVTHVSGTYNLPFGRGKQFFRNDSLLVDTFVGGWITNYIVTHQSGQPFTVYCPRATTSGFGCFADLVPGQSLYANPHNAVQWLNPKAFAQPAPATQIGQSDYSPLGGAPNQARGPGFSNVDFSLFKEFALRESLKFQFRAEGFNIFNSHSFGQPGNLDFTNANNFSQITYSRNNARLGQFALKLIY